MNFVSSDFVIFFIVVFTLFFSLPDRYRNHFLLLASYFFYGYWSVKYLILLIFTMGLDYFLAIKIYENETPARRKFFLGLSIVANLGILFVFKYFNFMSESVSQLTGWTPLTVHLILPFGISFYTFHAMSYVIDVYRRVVPAERQFVNYSNYVMFFPQLVAGPIARASHLLHQFATPKRIKRENIIEGSYLILKGYAMKMILADALGGYVSAYWNGPDVNTTPFTTFQAVYLFAFQIYFDFYGYTEIARGLARLMDFSLVENFNRPYWAINITDFWSRWHMSLSTWLRDYLYISLGGNRTGKWKTYRNLAVTMLLGGLWHGANITFVVWGGLHGLYLIIEKAFGLSRKTPLLGPLPRALSLFLTFQLVCFAWVFFRSSSLHEARWVIIDCIKFISHPSLYFQKGDLATRLWILCGVWFAFEWAEAKLHLFDLYRKCHWAARCAAIYSVLTTIFLFAELHPQTFIYFQF